MPFEVAESQKDNNKDNLLASHGPVLQQSAVQDHSMLFVDKQVLFDGIS